jgi:hypothetical protein
VSPIAALSYYSPLTNCLLQISCSQDIPWFSIHSTSGLVICSYLKGNICIPKSFFLSYDSPQFSHHHSTLPFQTASTKYYSGPNHDDCFKWNSLRENKNGLFNLGYHFPWWSSLGANFQKGNDTFFLISTNLSFSLDEPNCCSIILRSTHK